MVHFFYSNSINCLVINFFNILYNTYAETINTENNIKYTYPISILSSKFIVSKNIAPVNSTYTHTYKNIKILFHCFCGLSQINKGLSISITIPN